MSIHYYLFHKISCLMKDIHVTSLKYCKALTIDKTILKALSKCATNQIFVKSSFKFFAYIEM